MARGDATIGEAAASSGVSAKMIRYYEMAGLIDPAPRTSAGYRLYAPADVATLRFLRRARGLEFSVPQMRLLLDLWRDEDRASAEVKKLVLAHADALHAKAASLAAIGDELLDLASRCPGDRLPHCAIIEELAEFGQVPARPAATR
jgi:MerR family copper efflux transcriptional regulator